MPFLKGINSGIRKGILHPIYGDEGPRYLKRYFRTNNGVGDYYQLLEPINIGSSEDFELQVIVHMTTAAQGNIFGSNNDAISSRLTINPTGQLEIVLNGKLVNMGAYTGFGKLSTIIIKRSGGSSCTVTVDGIQKGAFIESGAIDIDWFGKEKVTVIELEGVLADFKLWRGADENRLLTDWYKFDDPNSIYQRNYAVPQGVELQSSILGEDFGGFTPESSNGQITIVGDEFRAAKISNNGPANIKRVITLKAGKTYKITVQHSSAELGIRGMAVGSPNDGSGSAKWDYYSGWIYSDSNGHSELVVTLDYNNIWLYLSSGLTVGSYIGYSNVSIQEWSGAEIIGGMPEDWFKVERQPHWNYWLKPEIVTQSLWENPSSYADQWSYNPENNKWTYLGDGSLSALQLLASADQPEKMLISGVAERISGSGSFALCASTTDEYTVSDAQFLDKNPYTYNINMNKSIGGGQQYKRRSGVLTVELNKPSFREILEIAQ